MVCFCLNIHSVYAKTLPDVFLSENCKLEIPDGFELVKPSSAQDNYMYKKFGMYPTPSIEVFPVKKDFLVTEFADIPLEVVTSVELPDSILTVFYTLGMKPSLNIRFSLLENKDFSILISSVEKDLLSNILGQCIDYEIKELIVEQYESVNFQKTKNNG